MRCSCLQTIAYPPTYKAKMGESVTKRYKSANITTIIAPWGERWFQIEMYMRAFQGRNHGNLVLWAVLSL